MATFLEELEGHVAALNRDLLAWEKTTQPGRVRELLTTLRRTVHSVKGASRAVSLGLVEQVCHRLEEVLGTVQPGQPVTPEVLELGFAVADALDDARQRLGRKQELAGSPLEALLPRLAAAAQGPRAAGESRPAPSVPSTPAPSLRRRWLRLRLPRLIPSPCPRRRARRPCPSGCPRRSWMRCWRAAESSGCPASASRDAPSGPSRSGRSCPPCACA